jgi:hypothetical protein
MRTAVKSKKIGDMTVDELRSVIRDTMHEFIDPDHGLTLQSTIEKELKESRKARAKGEGVSLSTARKRLGLT